MNLRSPEALATIALGLFALVTTSRATAMAQPSTRIEVARVRTAPSTRSQWIGSRLAAARAALASSMPQLSSSIRESIARDFVAHWLRETGATDEFDFNVGNVIAPASYVGPFYLSSSGHPFKAFSTLPQAVANYVALVSSGRYAASWAQLLSAPDDVATWNVALVQAGYEAASTANLAEVARELPSNRAAVDAWVASNG